MNRDMTDFMTYRESIILGRKSKRAPRAVGVWVASAIIAMVVIAIYVLLSAPVEAHSNEVASDNAHYCHEAYVGHCGLRDNQRDLIIGYCKSLGVWK